MTNLGFVSLIAVGPHSVLLEGVESASHSGCAMWICRECRALGVLWPGPPGPAVRGPPGCSSCPRGVWAGRAAEAHRKQSAPRLEPMVANSQPAFSGLGGGLRLGFRSPWIFRFVFPLFLFLFFISFRCTDTVIRHSYASPSDQPDKSITHLSRTVIPILLTIFPMLYFTSP